ncbi:MAG TPA: hypothetical protein VFV37_04380 [Luteibaculaceae bacterium]|nr:hypothetical protein [Luteibaculaceae bacterium]
MRRKPFITVKKVGIYHFDALPMECFKIYFNHVKTKRPILELLCLN